MQAQHYSFDIGAFHCQVISDGNILSNVRSMFANAPEDLLQTALQKYEVTAGQIITPLNCLVIQHGNDTILIDTGIGTVPGAGQLLPNLWQAGIDDINLVILTHAHLDHIGGITDSAGAPVFPNARYILSKPEWDFWHSAESVTYAGEEKADRVRFKLACISASLELIPPETTLLPGLRTIPAPGHTPGQIMVEISSEGQELWHVADVIAHPLHIEFPDWHIISDTDPVQAIRTRADLLGRTGLFFGYHFPFPGLLDKARPLG